MHLASVESKFMFICIWKLIIIIKLLKLII